jgi:diguanylate cyclase (GGDEF)-like protein
MFVTNFKKLAFSNKGFQDFFNIQNNAEYRDNLLDIFTKNTGFLSSSMLKENETFYDLIERTSSENRTVSVLDKTFHINATKTSYNKNRDGSDYCLVTLTDITNRIRIQEEMEQKAYTDSLTGVPNRNKFNDVVEKQFSIDARYKENLTISILDIDHFKKFNDTFGHLIGDEVLIMLAKYVTDSIRTADTFARWGGEEFVLLFPKTDKERAKNVCDKLRIGISNLEHKVAGNITASFGVAQYQDGDTLETMFKRCDDALYKAKENGRNQVVVI